MAYQLAYSELAGLWIEAGGSGQSAAVAAAIATAESGGCQYAKAGPTDDRPVKACTYRQTTLENSYGFWQINRDAHPQYDAATLYDQLGNARAAVAISNGGTDFGPWSTYTNGAYRQYLQANFVPTIPGPTGGTTTGSLSGTGPATSTHQVDRAWNRLMHTIGITVPDHLDSVAAARARIRNAVR